MAERGEAKLPTPQPWFRDLDIEIPSWLNRVELEATADMLGISIEDARGVLFEESNDDPTKEGEPRAGS